MRYEEEINEAAAFYNVDARWLKAVFHIESRGRRDPHPRWEPHLAEHSYGLGQILPSTALWMLRTPARFPIPDTVRQTAKQALEKVPSRGESAFNKLLQDPKVNIFLTAAYLRYQYDRYGGSITDAVAAYNAGSVRKKSNGEYVNQRHVDKFNDALKLYA